MSETWIAVDYTKVVLYKSESEAIEAAVRITSVTSTKEVLVARATVGVRQSRPPPPPEAVVPEGYKVVWKFNEDGEQYPVLERLPEVVAAALDTMKEKL